MHITFVRAWNKVCHSAIEGNSKVPVPYYICIVGKERNDTILSNVELIRLNYLRC